MPISSLIVSKLRPLAVRRSNSVSRSVSGEPLAAAVRDASGHRPYRAQRKTEAREDAPRDARADRRAAARNSRMLETMLSGRASLSR
jgi:hypothetical protein